VNKGVLQMQTSALCKKLRIFQNLWCVHMRQKGLSQCGYFTDKGGGGGGGGKIFFFFFGGGLFWGPFCDFVGTSFMDGSY